MEPVVQSPKNCYLFTVKGEFFTRLRFKEKIFAIYNLIGSQFCDKTSFSRRQIAIKIYANQGLAQSGVEPGPGSIESVSP